jgi:hypothetical protein
MTRLCLMTGESMCEGMHWWLGMGKGIVCISGCMHSAARMHVVWGVHWWLVRWVPWGPVCIETANTRSSRMSQQGWGPSSVADCAGCVLCVLLVAGM